jgi:uroporphyrinogen decarboxylase
VPQLVIGTTSRLPLVDSSPFLAACGGSLPATTPIWLMRQAGRILKPYRDIRARTGSLEVMFKSPDLATEITLMPVEQLNVDAAILFADLVTPLEPMGFDFCYDPGPVFSNPVRCAQDVARLKPIDVESDLPFLPQIVRQVCDALPSEVPLIGYGGGPFTLASWAVEGTGAKDFPIFRSLRHAEPIVVEDLMQKLTTALVSYLRSQVQAGARALQIFDTSIGLLSTLDFERFALPHLQRVFAELESCRVPRIYFGLGASHLLPLIKRVGADVVSIDWRIPPSQAYEILGDATPLQGNLDPCALLGGEENLVSEAQRIVDDVGDRPHIFNLGHGLLPNTPVEMVRRLVEVVHDYSAARKLGAGTDGNG